jgi:hypothetical protein
MMMPPVPKEIFLDAIKEIVAANSRWIPPTNRFFFIFWTHPI